MNKQRAEVYSFRNDVLHTQNPLLLVEEILESLCASITQQFFTSRTTEGGWNAKGYCEWLVTNFPLSFDLHEYDNDYLTTEQIEKMTAEKIISAFKKKVALQIEGIEKAKSLLKSSHEIVAEHIVYEIICNLLVRSIDRLWQEHLLNIDHLRTEVNLRSIGNKDPLLEFKHEAFQLFADLSQKMKIEIAHALFKFEMVLPEPEPRKLKLVDSKKQKKESLPTRPLIDLSLLDDDNLVKM